MSFSAKTTSERHYQNVWLWKASKKTENKHVGFSVVKVFIQLKNAEHILTKKCIKITKLWYWEKMHKVSLTYPSGASSEEDDRYSYDEIKWWKHRRRKIYKKRTKRKRKNSVRAAKQVHYITAEQHWTNTFSSLDLISGDHCRWLRSLLL